MNLLEAIASAVVPFKRCHQQASDRWQLLGTVRHCIRDFLLLCQQAQTSAHSQCVAYAMLAGYTALRYSLILLRPASLWVCSGVTTGDSRHFECGGADDDPCRAIQLLRPAPGKLGVCQLRPSLTDAIRYEGVIGQILTVICCVSAFWSHTRFRQQNNKATPPAIHDQCHLPACDSIVLWPSTWILREKFSKDSQTDVYTVAHVASPATPISTASTSFFLTIILPLISTLKSIRNYIVRQFVSDVPDSHGHPALCHERRS